MANKMNRIKRNREKYIQMNKRRECRVKEEKIKIYKRSNKGITLIGLIITIIVLLILAAVTINLTLGEGRNIYDCTECSKTT